MLMSLDDQMTEDEYYLIIKNVLGLKATCFQETFLDVNGKPFSVPHPRNLTDAERREIIEKIRQRLCWSN
jgi:hypothetical protein